MNKPTRGAAALLSSVALVAGGALATTAEAADLVPSRITVATTDAHVGSGQEFALRGRLSTRTGRSLTGMVKVQTLRSGEWVNLTGARVATAGDGRYRVRVVLSQRGSRELRVVGNPWADRFRNSRARIAIQVG